MQLKELNAKKTERGLVITLGDVLFSTNKAQLKSGGMRNVQKLADFLKQYPQHKVLVEGYTDSTGSDSLNQELSERRANAVRTALLDMGISSDRINTRGYGEAFPVARQRHCRQSSIESARGNRPLRRERQHCSTLAVCGTSAAKPGLYSQAKASVFCDLIRRSEMSLGTILLIILVLMLVGAIPTWPHSRTWGYGPSGGLGLVLIIVIILLLMGRL